jgi:hypothetical protein
VGLNLLKSLILTNVYPNNKNKNNKNNNKVKSKPLELRSRLAGKNLFWHMSSLTKTLTLSVGEETKGFFQKIDEFFSVI